MAEGGYHRTNGQANFACLGARSNSTTAPRADSYNNSPNNQEVPISVRIETHRAAKETADRKADRLQGMAILHQLMNAQMRQFYNRLSDPHELWITQKKKYGEERADGKYLMSQLYALTYKDTATITEYIGQINSTVEQLVSMGEQISDTTNVTVLLNRLPWKFDFV